MGKQNGITFRFIGHCPGGAVREMQYACEHVVPGVDGVVVIGPAINLQYRPHVRLLVEAVAALTAAGCKQITVQWAVPF